MGKLIILSGPSCVGKGPMVTTLEIFLKSINKKLTRHVLYNTRAPRKREIHGETYWYSYLWDVKNHEWDKEWSKKINDENAYNKYEAKNKMTSIMEHAIEKKQHFEIFAVREDLQGLNYSVLEEELRNNDVVLLEIFQEKADDVVTFCKKKGFEVKRIFISPLSDEDYKAEGCSTPEERAVFTERTMRGKLDRRGEDSEESIEKRAKNAIEEVENARALRDKGEKDFIYFVNHFGEDMKSEWAELQRRVVYYHDKKSGKSVCLDIAITFWRFLEQIFPETFEHQCDEHRNACCKCEICGDIRHDCTFSNNYGFGIGRVTATCSRCGYTETFNDDLGD